MFDYFSGIQRQTRTNREPPKRFARKSEGSHRFHRRWRQHDENWKYSRSKSVDQLSEPGDERRCINNFSSPLVLTRILFFFPVQNRMHRRSHKTGQKFVRVRQLQLRLYVLVFLHVDYVANWQGKYLRNIANYPTKQRWTNTLAFSITWASCGESSRRRLCSKTGTRRWKTWRNCASTSTATSSAILPKYCSKERGSFTGVSLFSSITSKAAIW